MVGIRPEKETELRQRRTAVILAVIVIAFATVVIASTLSAGDGTASHAMPDGSTMQDERMP